MPAHTTYRHDYIDPREMSLSFLAASLVGDAVPKKECKCLPAVKIEDAMATELNEKAGATVEGLGQSEWTGIAPMGILIKPRIIKNSIADDEDDLNACFQEKPNRYLKNLPNTYPTLYEDLKKMNKDDMAKVTNVDRLKTTYQVDYCGGVEYPSGTYDDNVMTEDSIKEELKDPCCEQSIFPDTRSNGKKPFVHIKRSKVVCDHCPIKKEEHMHCTATEYTAKVEKIGKVIMQERLNDHSKCKTKCEHAIRYSLLK